MVNLNKSFINDQEKMIDFFTTTKDSFLSAYSYLTEEEYEVTKQEVLRRSGYWNAEYADIEDGITVGKIIQSIIFAELLQNKKNNDFNNRKENDIMKNYKIKGIELDVYDMIQIKNYYEEQCTMEFLLENYDLTEEKAKKLAYEVRCKMDKYGISEDDAIQELIDSEMLQ